MSLNERLTEIYGTDASAQRERYQDALEQFAALYGSGPCLLFRAPGRVNLIGGHTDYNEGYVLPVALDKDVVLALRPRTDGCLQLHNVEARFPPVRLDSQLKPELATTGEWGNYAVGVVRQLARRVDRPLLGFDGLVVASAPQGVPRGAGLSSSSALTVALALALAQLNAWQPPVAELIALCSDAEWFVGTRGGIMDHYISLLAQKNQALFLDCRPDEAGAYQTVTIPLPAHLAILVVNSGIKHQNARGHFNKRVAACRAGVQILRPTFPGLASLRDLEDVPWSVVDPLLPQQATVANLRLRGIQLDDLPGLTAATSLKVRARCRHIWSENQRVRQAIAALRQGDVRQLGRLLNAANDSLRNNYEVSCPEVDQLSAILQDQPGVAGVRLTGAGWGGCVVALVKETAVTAVRQKTLHHYEQATGIRPDIFVCRPGPGAGLVTTVTVGG